jgi:hypothetical protein
MFQKGGKEQQLPVEEAESFWTKEAFAIKQPKWYWPLVVISASIVFGAMFHVTKVSMRYMDTVIELGERKV